MMRYYFRDCDKHAYHLDESCPGCRAEKAERERDDARELLRRAYNEAMGHFIDSRELDEKILAVLAVRSAAKDTE